MKSRFQYDADCMKFSQCDTDALAEALASRRPFVTSGNLCGGPVTERAARLVEAQGSWAHHHPAWYEMWTEHYPAAEASYAVYSFNTPIGFVIPRRGFVVDAAAGWYSGFSSRANSQFRSALRTARIPVLEIGLDWMDAQRLSDHQRGIVRGEIRPQDASRRTREILTREGILHADESALTPRGLALAKWV